MNTAVMFGKATDKPRRGGDLLIRIGSHCERVGDCLVWRGTLSRDGYGSIKIAGRMIKMHRAVWEYTNGPIPAGMEIDHLKSAGCKSRACCKLEHLEAVTRRENILRSDSPGGIHARQTHCVRGHELIGDNLSQAELRRGVRRCVACTRDRQRLRMRVVRAARKACAA